MRRGRYKCSPMNAQQILCDETHVEHVLYVYIETMELF